MKQLLPLALSSLCAISWSASAFAAEKELPAPELTEIWSPVPAKVDVPATTGIPSDAVVLFDGRRLDAWENTKPGSPDWNVADGAVTIVPASGSLRTKAAFGDMQLHVEFRSPTNDADSGQGRGNSGIMIMGFYEVQVLDSHTNQTYVNGQAASLYKQSPPLVNASRPAGEWQTYDIVFIAPRFHPDGTLRSPARLTVFHNGVLVQHDVALKGETVYRGARHYTPHAARLPLTLQNHTDEVSFRNIWLRELTSPAAP